MRLSGQNNTAKSVSGRESCACEARESALTPRGELRRLRRGNKRVDTCGFYPLDSRFPLFVSLAQTGDGDRFEIEERQRILSTVGEHNVLPFLYLFAMLDTGLLHISATLRRRDISVSRNSFAWWLRTAPADFTY